MKMYSGEHLSSQRDLELICKTMVLFLFYQWTSIIPYLFKFI